MKKCEYCGKEHNGGYGSGRFCSAFCARGFSSRDKRKEINEKVSKTLKGHKGAPKTEETIAKQKASLKSTLEKKYRDRKIKIGTDEIDITKEELNAYRSTHLVCEICGKPETLSTSPTGKPNKLCIDHDHATNSFRGLLCHNCNSRLGWYENHKDIIDEYLKRSTCERME